MSLPKMDVNSVLDFLRRNGFLEAEFALRDDIVRSGGLGFSNSRSELEEFPAPPPPVRIVLGRRSEKVDDGVDSSLKEGEDDDDDSSDFVSMGSSSDFNGSDMVNPYGVWSSTRIESDDSSDRLSQFGTARDYTDPDVLNDTFWYSERGGGFHEEPTFGGMDYSGSPSVDKFVMTVEAEDQFGNSSGVISASQGFHSVTSVNCLDDPSDLFTSERSFVEDIFSSEVPSVVANHPRFDGKIQREQRVKKCEGCTEKYICSIPLCDCCTGLKEDYSHRAREQIKDSDVSVYKCYEVISDDPKSIEAPELTTFRLNLVDESPDAVSWEQNVLTCSHQGTNSSRHKVSQLPKEELQMPDPLVTTRSFSTSGGSPSNHRSRTSSNHSNNRCFRNHDEEFQRTTNQHLYIDQKSFPSDGNASYKTGDAQPIIEESHNKETERERREHDTSSALQMYDNHEDEYEIFDLRIIHRKNRTGFEVNKDLPVVLNTIIAGRYYLTEYLGSAAFSKVIQAHDLQTRLDVCLKVIKNDKDFFDQSLDEIKLLKYVNRHDPADECHILRLYDYFYHQEHLFIVCELLRANLYEFQKFNHDSDGQIYFTLPRLQSITRQCLEALEYLHHLRIIHCDLKPENILIKSYSRCEIKVIDLGSSCFQTDNLCLYVQSRSYRAPEVILGLPYDEKIDIWSLGCILAELCSGDVLFPNDSLVMMLARMIGLFGPIDMEMLVNGQETQKYFTSDYDLYYRNEETFQLEYIIPEKSSLAHHLQGFDIGIVEFIEDLLQINPERRPTATQALQHPWLSQIYEYELCSMQNSPNFLK